MTGGLALLANGLWWASGAADAWRFRRGLARPATTQAAVLRRMVTANAGTEFGRGHDFARITTVADYQARVPLTTYDDLAPAIARMADGATQVLTAAPVRLFEPSSGSTAATKLIPYTAALQREFQAGLAAWVDNLYRHDPALAGGPAYWSVSPVNREQRTTAAGIPIGFAEDAAYLGVVGKLVAAALAVPAAVKLLGEMDAFRYATLRWLVATPSLRLISVWNPTFLTLLLDALAQWWEPLLADLATGTLTLPGDADPAPLAAATRTLTAQPGRAADLARRDPRDSATLAALWPRLRLLSCWADGPAARFAADLAARLPHVSLQPKGLLATEAMVSLPWVGAPGAVLAITSHFLEFMDAEAQVWTADALTVGEVYTVVVTTGGGLYRYQLRDQVEVVGRVAATPCIRFVGKADRVSDWFGEKVSEPFVAACLADLWRAVGRAPTFALLAPAETAAGVAYTLYVEGDGLPDDADLAAALETRLGANFHYAYCRRLGQLAAARVRVVQAGAATYLAVCAGRGVRLGDIKPALLDKQAVWEAAFVPASHSLFAVGDGPGGEPHPPAPSA